MADAPLPPRYRLIRLVARQLLLALVVGVALTEGFNGRVITAYFVSALAMGGVDVTEFVDVLRG